MNTQHLKKPCLVEAPFRSQSTSSFIKGMFLWSLGLLYSRAQRDSITCLLPSSPTLPCLRELDLSFCNLVQIPDAIGKLSCLEGLNLKGNNFATLPSLKDLSKLYDLNLQHCKRFKYLPDLPSRTDLHSKFPRLPSSNLINFKGQVGLNFFNCPKLVERERCTSMIFSWMIQVVQVCMLLPSSFLLLIYFLCRKTATNA